MPSPAYRVWPDSYYLTYHYSKQEHNPFVYTLRLWPWPFGNVITNVVTFNGCDTGQDSI